MELRWLDLTVTFAAGVALGLLVAILLDQVERKEAEQCHSPSP